MEKDNKLGKEIILLIYMMLKPLYFGASGSLQICDLFLVIGVAYVLSSNKLHITTYKFSNPLIKLFLFVTLYQLCVNLLWSFSLSNLIIKPNLYYIFNFSAFLLTINICTEIDKDRLILILSKSCVVSLLINSVGLLLHSSGSRTTGFFNNPNQLGYYGLIMFSFGIILFENKYKIITLVLSGWAIIASGSKASFVSVIIILFSSIIIEKNTVNLSEFLKKMIILCAIIFFVYLFFYSENNIIVSNHRIMFLRNRIINMSSENDSNLGTGRGYDRISEMGYHLLWGMGEGAFYRFMTMSGLEAHSSYITIIVSYGLIGLISYLFLFIKMFKRCNLKTIICVVCGVMLYGVSHNGLRNTLLWILFAVLFVISNRDWYNNRINKGEESVV